MSDDRTPAPNQPEQATGADAPRSETSGSPYAPRDDAATRDAAADTDAAAESSPDGAPASTHDSPAYGGPDAPTPAHDDAAHDDPAPAAAAAAGGAPSGIPSSPAPAYGEPATPPYDTTGGSSSTYGAPAYGTPAYGAPAPEAAAYGAPAYGAPAYGGSAYGTASYGYAGAAARTNPLAIVALVASLVGIFVIPVIGQIVGIVTGHISLKQIKATGERGRGMGLAGLLIGYISLGLGALLIIGFIILVAVGAGASGSRYGV
ncbi:protein of unknown function [Microbacterium sp. ru370.1]|uniref:DUF4190 domain-containing protein n=1 Tax=unclassified Microbacterium TaxID=2609290 RepID=UPI00088427AA|nr:MULTISPECIES: DUF4190 domain-containing protein [unclassified Microbacterium]SDO73315.1 protein of unknown function [Microbacterium sp. ru370.1]SIT87802.1 protein of unknown function [Microbacterium sp. RU1D]